jgi:hypothetical protein
MRVLEISADIDLVNRHESGVKAYLASDEGAQFSFQKFVYA